MKQNKKIGDEIKISNHEWVVRLIKLGEAKIPKYGFYRFENPELDDLLEKALQSERERVMEDIKEMLLLVDDFDLLKKRIKEEL